MAKRRPAHYGADVPTVRAFVREATVRCGWCGLTPSAEDRALAQKTQLCGACFEILRHVDWKKFVGPQEG
jgi:hypothetical protein